MKELNNIELINLNGGVDGGKVLSGGIEIVGGVITGALTGWTGFGAAGGALAIAGGVGEVIRGFEEE